DGAAGIALARALFPARRLLGGGPAVPRRPREVRGRTIGASRDPLPHGQAGAGRGLGRLAARRPRRARAGAAGNPVRVRAERTTTPPRALPRLAAAGRPRIREHRDRERRLSGLAALLSGACRG